MPSVIPDDNVLEANEKLIFLVDEELKNRLKYGDAISTKDLIAVKAEAFRESQLLK
jgi:hypothetical protein